MRLFVSVPVPEELKERAGTLALELPRDAITPVKPPNMHLTLRFIGETGDPELETIKGRLAGVKFAPFSCTLRGAGVFPDENYVRVVWVGCESGGALEALAKDVIAALHGFGRDERFTAHLTVARVKRKIDAKQFLEKHKGEDFGSFDVKGFHLVRSVLSPQGPQYTIIAGFGAETGNA